MPSSSIFFLSLLLSMRTSAKLFTKLSYLCWSV
jgi:hypothetical protein